MLSAEPTHPREVFFLEVERTANRLRSMSLDKLESGTRVADTRAVINEIAAHGALITGHAAGPVPALSSSALADQLVVVAAVLPMNVEENQVTGFSEALRSLRATL